MSYLVYLKVDWDTEMHEWSVAFVYWSKWFNEMKKRLNNEIKIDQNRAMLNVWNTLAFTLIVPIFHTLFRRNNWGWFGLNGIIIYIIFCCFFFFLQFLEIGVVTSIECNHKQVESARKGQEVCIKIEPIPGESPKMYGRHFEEQDMLVSKVSKSTYKWMST